MLGEKFEIRNAKILNYSLRKGPRKGPKGPDYIQIVSKSVSP